MGYNDKSGSTTQAKPFPFFFFVVGRGSKKRQRNKLAAACDDRVMERGVEGVSCRGWRNMNH